MSLQQRPYLNRNDIPQVFPDDCKKEIPFSLSHLEPFVPVTQIIDSCQGKCAEHYSKVKLQFVYQAVIKAIESCLAGKYSDFDGHTTSNCCHGMALFACITLRSVLKLDLTQLEREGKQKLQELEKSQDKELACRWWVPQSLVDLACLYILCLVREIDPLKGGRTSIKKLKTLALISSNFSKQVTNHLQSLFSNLTANRYKIDLETLNNELCISGIPLKMWGKYVQDQYIRTDKNGIHYVSNLFSMQVLFGYLTQMRIKVALINDIFDLNDNLKSRYVRIFEGDGKNILRLLSFTEMHELSFFHRDEPTIVFGGCAYLDSDDIDSHSIDLAMEPWLHQLSSLLLACDVFYPQFFPMIDDFDFNSQPIVPVEEELKELIEQYSNTKGVSSKDPSLYCATHIYPASLRQVLQVLYKENENALPLAFIPGVKLTHAISK